MDGNMAGSATGFGGWAPWQCLYAAAEGTSGAAHRCAGRWVDRPAGHDAGRRPSGNQEARRTDVHTRAVGYAFAPNATAYAAQGSTPGRWTLQLSVLPRLSGVVRFSTRSQASDECHVFGMPRSGGRFTAGHSPRGDRSGKVPVLPPAGGQRCATGAWRSRRPQGRRLSKVSPAGVKQRRTRRGGHLPVANKKGGEA
jgi:hypothetical protein